jgi:hypothetical protein
VLRDSCLSILSLLSLSLRTGQFKLCVDLFRNCVWHCFYKISGFFSGKKLATFGYVVEVFLPRKYKRISENVCLVSNLKTAPPIQKTHVCKISISVYLGLLETVYVQIYIYEVNLKTGAKTLCVKCALHSQILIKIVIT